MDINQTIENLTRFYDSGRNPQQAMQMFMGNGNPQQIEQMKVQMKNMANGRSPANFIIEIAKQNGASEQNLKNLARILGGN